MGDRHAARPRLVWDNSGGRAREKSGVKFHPPLPTGGLHYHQHVRTVREGIPGPPVDDGGFPDTTERSNDLGPTEGLENVRNRLRSTIHRGAVYSNHLNIVKPLELELTKDPEIRMNQSVVQPKKKPSAAPHPRSFAAIAARLLAFRNSKKWSQVELCRRAGIEPNTYNMWENAKGRPGLDLGIKLRDGLGLPLDWIYLGDRACLPNHITDKLPPIDL